MGNTAQKAVKTRPFLSVIIPAYNEALRIKTTLASVDAYLRSKKYKYEIIVVDDGSTDRTIRVVQELTPKIKNLTVVTNGKNRGKGYAVQNGMRRARGKMRLFMDADNSVEIGHLDSFLRWSRRGYDVVIGSIHIEESRVMEHSGWHRRILGEVANFLVRFMATPDIRDTQRGFKLFTDEVAREIFSRQTIERFGFDIEILVIARKLGFSVKEVPVIWDNPAGSKVGIYSYVQTLRELFRISLNSAMGKYGA